jgi:hypothetical protein
MSDSDWPLDEADQPRTDLHRHHLDGGRHHEIVVTAIDATASVRLDITDPTGLIIGRISGEIPAAGLTAAGDLLGATLTAVGRAHASGAEPGVSRMERKRQQHRNHGARWTPDEEVLLTERFNAGVPIAEIREELGRNDNSIRARLVQLGLLAPDQWPAGIGERPRAA